MDKAALIALAEPTWQDMASAPRDREILLLLGETIPDHADARAGTYVPGLEASELGWQEYAHFGAWMIWSDAEDWFLVDVTDPLGWLPLPKAFPRGHKIIDVGPAALRAIAGGV